MTNVTPLSKDTSLDSGGEPTHQDHWTAHANNDQRLRAEAAIIAGTILRSRGGFVGSGPTKPNKVILLASWIIEGWTTTDD